MTFWEFMGGLFTGDSYYPDNPHRESRAKELALDCQNYSSWMAKDTETIQNDLILLNKQLAILYGNQGDIAPEAQSTNMNIRGMVFEVAQFLTPLMMDSTVSYALEIGAISYLVSTGVIQSKELGKVVELPECFEIAKVVSGCVSISFPFAMGFAEGSIKRDQLRPVIFKAVLGRQNLAYGYLVISQLKSSICTIIDLIKALPAVGLQPSQIVDNLKMTVSASCEDISKITYNYAVHTLVDLDAGRGSWTNEDNPSKYMK